MDEYDLVNYSHITDDFFASTTLHPCTIETITSRLFACASYELDEVTNHRKGQLDIYDGSCKLIKSYCIDHGILDMKVIHIDMNEQVNLLVGDSSGCLSLYKLTYKDLDNSHIPCNLELNESSLDLVASQTSNRGLTLSTDYSGDSYIASYQDGSISVMNLTSTGMTIDQVHENTHVMMSESQPVWFVSFKKNSTSNEANEISTANEFMSGGDDCTLRLWDLRIGLKSCNSIHVVKNQHDAGVTCGQWHPAVDHIVTTGSYDEHVRFFDDRYWKQPLLDIHAGNIYFRDLLAILLYYLIFNFTYLYVCNICRWRRMANEMES